MAPLKDWYLDALNTKSWSKYIAISLNKDFPVPTRPCKECHVRSNANPCRCRRQPRQNKPHNKAQPFLPRHRNQREERRQRIRGDQAFQKLGLESGSTIKETDQAYHKLSQIYHPDLQNRSVDADGHSTWTGLTTEETTELQMLNTVR